MAEFEPLWRYVAGLPVFALVSAPASTDARDVVLVHGLGLSGTYLMPTARLLAGDYRVWVPDLPGFGRSGKPRRVWDVPELGDALGEWMAAVGLQHAALLGNSFGCQVILECAARYPQRVERAILQGPTTSPQERSWLRRFVRWRQNPNPGMDPIAHADYRAAGLFRVLKTFRYSIKHRPEVLLPQIKAPVLVVRGARDPICRQDWAEEVTRRLPMGQLVVIPDVHHTLVFQNPQELVRVCRPFLDGRKPPECGYRTVPPQGDDAAASTAPVAGFDSASAMLRAVSAALHGRGFPVVGLWSDRAIPALRVAGAGVNALPRPLQEQVYIWSGWSEALRAERIGAVRSAELARWAVERYPQRRFPAAMLGSSNGALVHLCAALGIPWLPQTFLIPVKRSGIDANDPSQGLEWGKEPGARLLEANPDLVLHHMHDPNQDQLMVRRMGYFRVKLRRLPPHYRRFLAEVLSPGATLYVADCQLRWPSVTVADHHYFQPGALGGIAPEKYLRANPEVADFLERLGAHRRSWEGPLPDAQVPEAEWGFDPAIYDELEAFAREHQLEVRRLVFDHPEQTSPLVADLYRDWYARRGIRANQLLVSSFILMDPHWTLRTGSVPYWSVFNTEPSADALQSYLESVPAYDAINLMLFSHGVESVGNAPIERWESLLRKARQTGRFIGVDTRAYPRDFAVFARYHSALRRAVRERYPLPPALALDEFHAFLDSTAGRYRVHWA